MYLGMEGNRVPGTTDIREAGLRYFDLDDYIEKQQNPDMDEFMVSLWVLENGKVDVGMVAINLKEALNRNKERLKDITPILRGFNVKFMLEEVLKLNQVPIDILEGVSVLSDFREYFHTDELLTEAGDLVKLMRHIDKHIEGGELNISLTSGGTAEHTRVSQEIYYNIKDNYDITEFKNINILNAEYLSRLGTIDAIEAVNAALENDIEIIVIDTANISGGIPDKNAKQLIELAARKGIIVDYTQQTSSNLTVSKMMYTDMYNFNTKETFIQGVEQYIEKLGNEFYFTPNFLTFFSVSIRKNSNGDYVMEERECKKGIGERLSEYEEVMGEYRVQGHEPYKERSRVLTLEPYFVKPDIFPIALIPDFYVSSDDLTTPIDERYKDPEFQLGNVTKER